jgi:hypothetical protein
MLFFSLLLFFLIFNKNDKLSRTKVRQDYIADSDDEARKFF